MTYAPLPVLLECYRALCDELRTLNERNTERQTAYTIVNVDNVSTCLTIDYATYKQLLDAKRLAITDELHELRIAIARSREDK